MQTMNASNRSNQNKAGDSSRGSRRVEPQVFVSFYHFCLYSSLLTSIYKLSTRRRWKINQKRNMEDEDDDYTQGLATGLETHRALDKCKFLLFCFTFYNSNYHLLVYYYVTTTRKQTNDGRLHHRGSEWTPHRWTANTTSTTMPHHNHFNTNGDDGAAGEGSMGRGRIGR